MFVIYHHDDTLPASLLHQKAWDRDWSNVHAVQWFCQGNGMVIAKERAENLMEAYRNYLHHKVPLQATREPCIHFNTATPPTRQQIQL